MPVREGAPAIEAKAPVTGVMIGTPMYGGNCFDAYLLGLWDFQAEAHKRGINIALHTIRNESLIPRARNRVLADFLASHCSHLVMIDADIGFAARDVFRLVAHGKPLVGATYAKKDRTKYAPAFVPLPGPAFQRDDDGLVEVQCIPGGFMCIHRETAVMMQGFFHDLWYLDGSEDGQRRVSDLFGCYTDPETRAYWSEDYAFCQRWRRAGGQVWLDPNILLSHNGTTQFEGDPTSIWAEVPKAAEPAPPAIPLRQGHGVAPPIPPRADWHSIGAGDLRPKVAAV